MKNTIKTILKKAFSAAAIIVLIYIGCMSARSAYNINKYIVDSGGANVWLYNHEYVEMENGFHEWVPTNRFQLYGYDISNIEVGVCIPSIVIFCVVAVQLSWEVIWVVKKIKTSKKEETKEETA